MWEKIKKAPRDGTKVWISWEEEGMYLDICKMFWSPSNKAWKSSSPEAYWPEEGGNGPTHFQYIQ